MTTPASETIQVGETELRWHVWTPPSKPVGVCVVYHGFLAHGRFPTVKYAAELLVSRNYQVYAPDMPGHGESPGRKGYLPPPSALIELCVRIAKQVQAKHANLSLFLLGSSMGGTLALATAQSLSSVSGVALLAPMLKLSVSTIERYLLGALAAILPTVQAIPSKSTSSEAQCRDLEKREECDNDPLTVKSKTIYIGSAHTCVQLTECIDASAIQCPVLVLVADEDTVVDAQGAVDFFDAAATTDKECKRYPALHALLCEPAPLFDTISGDLLTWIEQRTK